MTDPDTAAVEAWQRHAWEDETGERCGECGQPWPCDIAKAWRHGYSWAKVEQSLGELRERLGASDGT